VAVGSYEPSEALSGSRTAWGDSSMLSSPSLVPEFVLGTQMPKPRVLSYYRLHMPAELTTSLHSPAKSAAHYTSRSEHPSGRGEQLFCGTPGIGSSDGPGSPETGVRRCEAVRRREHRCR